MQGSRAFIGISVCSIPTLPVRLEMPPKATNSSTGAAIKASGASGTKATTSSSSTSTKTATTKPTAVKPAAGKLAPAAAKGAGTATKAKPAASASKATAGKTTGKAVVSKDKPVEAPAASAEAVLPELTEEEQRARIQEALSRALAETEETRKKAWQAEVEAERRKEAARRKKAEEEAKRKKEEARLRKAALEAAYDDEEQQVVQLMNEAESKGIKNVLEFCDAHGNTLLSEAAAGGALSTVQMLISKGANPNTQGEFKRSPLWRAVFLGHSQCVQPLLEAGADPRIGNEQGEMPVHVANNPEVKELLASWDTSKTDQLVAHWESTQQQRRATAVAAVKAAVGNAQDKMDQAEENNSRCQQALRHARQELEKRIFEHDTCVEEKKGDELLKVTLEQIRMAEERVTVAQAEARAAFEALDMARLALREQQLAERETLGQEGGSAADEEQLPGVLVDIKELDAVLIRDVGGRVAASKRWPLLIDTSGQASVFLRYMDSNYVNALSPHHMEPNRLRRSLLGALRYGKPLVLDLMDVAALWTELPSAFDRIKPGLLQSLLDKSLLSNEGFMSLVKAEDGAEYESSQFQGTRLARFILILHTAAIKPPQDMIDATYPLRVNFKG